MKTAYVKTDLWTYSKLLPLRYEDNQCCLACQCLFMVLEKQKGKRQMSRKHRKGKQTKRMSVKEKYGLTFIFNAFILESHSPFCYQNSEQNHFFFFFLEKSTLVIDTCCWAVVLITGTWTVYMECNSLVPDVDMPLCKHAWVHKHLTCEHSLACDLAIWSSRLIPFYSEAHNA